MNKQLVKFKFDELCEDSFYAILRFYLVLWSWGFWELMLDFEIVWFNDV
jgi:hypothetical protein